MRDVRPPLRLSLRSSRTTLPLAAGLAVALGLAACSTGSSPAGAGGQKTIVVTYTVLGSVVKDLVGDAATVVVLMPNGADPHEWEPSAKDIETLTHADLLVENGLDLEGGMTNAFAQAEKAGVRRFVATDHITIRTVGTGEGVNPTDPDQAAGASDPHLWMDPLTVRDVVDALAVEIRTDLGIDLDARAKDLDARLGTLSDKLAATTATIPADHRKLVTGHESMGYFAARYGLTLIGAIVPSLTTAAQTSAANLAALTATVRAAGVPAVFTELGTSPAVAEALARDTGIKVVELTTHALPPDGSYFTFMQNLASLIADNLR
jgi:zinc/manganese transport system substrate-binding protein